MKVCMGTIVRNIQPLLDIISKKALTKGCGGGSSQCLKNFHKQYPFARVRFFYCAWLPREGKKDRNKGERSGIMRQARQCFFCIALHIL